MPQEARDHLHDEPLSTAFLSVHRSATLRKVHQDPHASQGDKIAKEEPQLQDGLPRHGLDADPLR